MALECVLLAIGAWVLSFFRDPDRDCPQDPAIFLAPADGKVVDIRITDRPDMGGKAVCIGIFMSIFDVHINRAPCHARVVRIDYQPGLCINALSAASSHLNESNNIWLERIASPSDTILVRQISGAIARRIVCAVVVGQVLTAGQRMGMIKFGSRTELYVPFRPGLQTMVQPGQKVRAGLTPLLRYADGQIQA